MPSPKFSKFNVLVATMPDGKQYLLKMLATNGDDTQERRRDTLAVKLFNTSESGMSHYQDSDKCLELASQANFTMAFRWDDYGCEELPDPKKVNERIPGQRYAKLQQSSL